MRRKRKRWVVLLKLKLFGVRKVRCEWVGGVRVGWG